MKIFVRCLLVGVLALLATVSSSPYCPRALALQAQGQDPAMPPEGNPDHVEPPTGAYCNHSKEPAHACACHAKCVTDDQGQVQIQEDGVHCRAYCYKKFCRCPADGCQAPAARPTP